MVADRIVLPIPPGMHWSEVKDVIMPTLERREETKALPEKRAMVKRVVKKVQSITVLSGALYFAAPEPVVAEKPVREKRKKVKNDPKFVAAARELRDRWLEQMNSGNVIVGNGKYEVAKLAGDSSEAIEGVVVQKMIAA